MRIAEKFDSWVQTGPFNSLDLAIYRIVYSVSVLCLVPGIQWLDEYPDSMYAAPLGPFQLLTGFPELGTLTVLEIMRSFALVLLLLGIWTRWVSIVAAVLLLVTFGLSYTLGKIDHTQFLVIAPLLLGFANWGDRLSIDSLLKRNVSRPTPQWPLRFLALVIGLSFFEAAAVKFGTGWLELSSQAVRGHFLEDFVARAADTWLTAWAFRFNVAPVWELLDWMTVILEFSILLTVPWWRAFRVALACATFFHLGVLLVMNIPFAANLVAYGAFVSWGVLSTWCLALSPRPGDRRGADRSLNSRQVRALVAGLLLAGSVLALGAWLLLNRTTVLIAFAKDSIVLIGAAIGLIYLVQQVSAVAKLLRKTAEIQSADSMDAQS